MRRSVFAVAVLAPLAIAAMPAQAQTASNDPAAGAVIAQGDLPGAEKALIGELRIHPDRPELLLNLAAVYARTGRTGEARGLYRKVLSQDDVLMDLSADRTAGSHAVATTSLRRLEATQLTAR